MAVDVATAPAFQVGSPRRLFRMAEPRQWEGSQYCVTPDGQRFLVLTPQGSGAIPPTNVIVNWTSGLKQR